jgi:transcriptional regulator GlxA family with amidase domain
MKLCSLLLATITAIAATTVQAAPLHAQAPVQATGTPEHMAPYVSRFGRKRAVVAVVAEKSAVLTDFIVPYGVLAQSGLADVVALSAKPGNLQLGPVTIQPDASLAQFDLRYPDGADYVIVPATSNHHEEEVEWLKAQAAKGATLISICDGVEVLADAGLLHDKTATGHWASYTSRTTNYPDTHWQTNIRYVVDGKVVSSAGISAAMPTALALVEAIGGTSQASALAQTLGVANWSTQHHSDAFSIRYSDRLTHWINTHLHHTDTIAVPIASGVDEIALGLQAEAWSRTMRSQAVVVAATAAPVRTRGGLMVVPGTTIGAATPAALTINLNDGTQDGQMLDAALDAIAERYNRKTARLVALVFEYPWKGL